MKNALQKVTGRYLFTSSFKSISFNFIEKSPAENMPLNNISNSKVKRIKFKFSRVTMQVSYSYKYIIKTCVYVKIKLNSLVKIISYFVLYSHRTLREEI